MIKKFLKNKLRNIFLGEIESQSRLITLLEEELKTSKSSVSQLRDVITYELGAMKIPPEHLQRRVTGVYSEEFFESGFLHIKNINTILEDEKCSISNFERILDFGCGCARVLRALHYCYPDAKLYGGDIDGEAIDWLKKNCGKMGQFHQFGFFPPTTFDSNFFDLSFGISVFTHIPEAMQLQWLNELARITKPGGYVILTTMGSDFWKDKPEDIHRIMNDKGLYYLDSIEYGKNIGLPEFYKECYHSENYIRGNWNHFFDFVRFVPKGLADYQDKTLLRKKLR